MFKSSSATLLKKRLWHRCFPRNFAKCLRTRFFIEHLWWLLLAVPITLQKVATISNGVKFYNSYRVSLVADALNAVNFKVDDKTYLTIQEVQSKESGQYTVTGCLWWINVIQIKCNRINMTRLREYVLIDETGHVCLTVLGSHILKSEENCYHKITG